MKLLIALSLCAVAVLALKSNERARYRYEEVDTRQVEAFRPGHEFHYRLDTQIATGLASVSNQHAITRLQAKVMLHFQTDRLVTLRLTEVIMGSLNQEISEPERVQPMEIFKKHEIKSEELKHLEFPCTFDFTDGLVERVRFVPEDKPWSENIKRSVLNMIQLNLKQRKGQTTMEPIRDEESKEYEQLLSSDPLTTTELSQGKMFVFPEITLEGECQTTYAINKMSPRSKYNAYYETETGSDELRMFNVTKTINFKSCKKIADIRYGPKTEKPCVHCKPQELEEQKLDRTTILRHVVVGTPEKYAIKKVELVSHYVFKMLDVEEQKPMHAIVAGELKFINMETSSRREESRVSQTGKDSTILYSIEFDEEEKRFYMYGDEEFPRHTPFEKIQNKPEKIEKLITKLVTLWSDKTNGIDSEATIVISRIVELLRMCSEEEVKQVFSMITHSNSRLTESQQIKAHDLVYDALANAGTRNTIQVLVEKILNREVMPIQRAVRAISQLHDLVAPSDKQVEIVIRLCQSEVAIRSEPLRQTCWLTAGSMIGELCSKTTIDDAFEEKKTHEELCPKHKKEKFIKTLVEIFRKADTRYEKILVLKALGNAGLDISVTELEKIIRDITEDPIVRMQAIDALRRLRALMPRKIQQILMPVFQNVRERPEVRMACVSMLLSTIPEKQILDQIGYILLKEPSRQVKSYVYTAMNFLADSPIEVEQKVAEHLKTLLLLAGISEEQEEEILKGSRFYRVPFYSNTHKEGLFFDLESMVGGDNVLPKHLSVGLDTLFNGIFQKNGLELTLTQEDVESWYQKLWSNLGEFYYGESPKKSSLRGFRNSKRESSEDNEESRDIFNKLSIKRRQRDSFSSRRVDSDSETNDSPFGMLYLRYADIDYMILPLEEEIMPLSLKKILVSGERPSIRDLEHLIELVQGRPFHLHTAISLFETVTKIPTSMGLPIRMIHTMPVLASIEGQIKPKLSSSDIQTEINVHASLTTTHLKRIETWSPIINTGCETTRTLVLNLPIESKITLQSQDAKKTLKMSLNVPQTKTRLVSFYSLPATYVSEQDWTQQRTPVLKRIEDVELINRVHHIETVVGHRNLGLPIRVRGECHLPRKMSYKAIVNTLMTSENHMHIDFEPTSETPREIQMLIEGDLFVKTSETSPKHHRELKNFYSKSKFEEENWNDFESEERDDETTFNKYLEDYEPRNMYKHFGKIILKTVGGRKERSGKLEVEAICDNKFQYCKTQLDVIRSPLFEEEKNEWKMSAKIQHVLPEKVNDFDELSETASYKSSDKNQKFVCTVECEWGSDKKQSINLNINGEKLMSRYWLQKINEVEKYDRYEVPKLREMMKRKVAFLNKYDLSVEYRINPVTKIQLSQVFTVLKAWNWWNTEVEMKEGREGTVLASLVIDPFTHEHVNMTIRTPKERVRINSVKLPLKMKPFKLVRPTQSSMDSVFDVVSNYASETRPECTVDSRKVRSFDDVIFKAPITKCYSVLAKDCSSERPRFVVLMKKIDNENQKLKIVTGSNTIEIEQESRDKLKVKINGRRVEKYEELQEYGIDYSEDMVILTTRDITVRFDGTKCKIQLSPFYKNTQCGICGHYDDDTEDEFRSNDNKLTSDLKSFHKSYSMVDEECREDLEETYRREEYEPISDSREYYERDEDYTERKRRTNENDEKTPVEKTEVIEYNHKVCFSVKPVKACPEGSYPENTKEVKTPFVCLERDSTEARRLLREARRYSSPVEVPSNKPSFVETITIPTICVVY